MRYSPQFRKEEKLGKVRGGTKIPTGMTRLRFFRSFFLNLEISGGEPLALLFFVALQRAVPLNGDSPFFVAGPLTGAWQRIRRTATNSKTIPGGKNENEKATRIPCIR